VLQLFDGKRTVDEIWRRVTAGGGDAIPSQDEVIRLLAQLHAGDLLQSSKPPNLEELLERERQQRWRKILQGVVNPMSIRIPLWDPDTFLARTWRIVRPLFGGWGVLLWLATVIPALGLVAAHWNELTENLSDQLFAAGNLFLIWLLYPADQAAA
jgi:putative peptide zinc metalloprotease protein